MAGQSSYYVPPQSKWPIIGAIALFLTLGGIAAILFSRQQGEVGWLPQLMFLAGVLLLAYMMYGWFSNVVREGQQGLYSAQMDRSYRWGMTWFIFSEVMFFAAFFGALFYARTLAVPWLGGEGDKGISNMLWPEFVSQWPLFQTPDPERFPGPEEIIDPWHIPLLNTVLLLTSSVTVTFAHHALKDNRRTPIKWWLLATILLGATFLFFQAYEYVEAYTEMGLTLNAGIYGATFFMLTGFHGAHVTIGTIMLIVILARVMAGHFQPDDHFGFEAVSWYWHFVDVVWVCLFLFVYIL